MNSTIKNELKDIHKELLKNGISRREAIKLLTTSGLLITASTHAQAQTLNASSLKAKIVIVGGGLSGIATAARLKSLSSSLDIIIIEPNLKSATYQPGNTFVGAGLYQKSDVLYNTVDFLPKEVTFIHDKVIDFYPENNQVVTSQKEVIEYDFLVIAAGMVLDFEKIKGLEELQEMYTVDESPKINDFFKDTMVSTVYNVNSAEQTWKNMQTIIEEAKKGKALKAIFTHPNTAIKCGGAPKKMMYLMNARLEEAKVRKNVELSLYAYPSKMFAVKEYEEAIIKQYEERQMLWNLNHNLIELNLKDKIATFDKSWQEKGEYDEDLEEYEMVEKHEYVDISYDFMHLTPPMKAPKEIAQSEVASANGWIPVNQETLQHVKYPNIFSLGDIAAVALGKTGGSVRKQYKIVANNIISAIKNEALEDKYDGYTVCPIITDIGKVMLAEFDWSMKPTPSFPLDPTQERYLWWLLKAYMLKPMTQYGMLSGKI
jgi:sulfide:quinone oxidoreductase